MEWGILRVYFGDYAFPCPVVPHRKEGLDVCSFQQDSDGKVFLRIPIYEKNDEMLKYELGGMKLNPVLGNE